MHYVRRPGRGGTPRGDWAALYDFARGSVDLTGNTGSMSPMPTGGFDARPGGAGWKFGTTNVSTTSGRIVPGISSGITLVMVAEPLATTTANNFLFAESAASTVNYNFGLYETSGGYLRAFVHNGTTGVSTPDSYQWSATRAPSVLVMTYGDGDNNIRLYVDGTEIASAAQTGNIQRNSGSHLSIQRWNTSGCSMVVHAAAVAPRRMTAQEVWRKFRTLSSTWDALFEPRRIWVPVSVGGGGGISLAPGAGALALSGHVPTIGQPVGLAPGAGSLALTGHAPTVAQPTTVAPGAGSVSVIGHAPAIEQPHAVAPAAGALAITGHAPDVSQVSDLRPSAGAITLIGYAPAIDQPREILAGAGQLVLTGHAPEVSQAEPASPSGGIMVGRFPFVQKRYVVRRGRKLLVFADHAQAQAVQQAVDKAADDARQVIERASQTSNRAARRARRSAQEAVEVMLSGLLRQAPPVEVADLREAQAMASAYHQHQAMHDAIRLRDYESALRMWQDMRDDEDAVAALLECTV